MKYRIGFDPETPQLWTHHRGDTLEVATFAPDDWQEQPEPIVCHDRGDYTETPGILSPYAEHTAELVVSSLRRIGKRLALSGLTNILAMTTAPNTLPVTRGIPRYVETWRSVPDISGLSEMQRCYYFAKRILAAAWRVSHPIRPMPDPEIDWDSIDDTPDDTTIPDEQPGTGAPEPQQQRDTLPDIVPDSVWLTAFALCTKEELPGIPWQDREEIRQELAVRLIDLVHRQMARNQSPAINLTLARRDRDRIAQRVSRERLATLEDVGYSTADAQSAALAEIENRRIVAQGEAWRAHLEQMQREIQVSQRMVGQRLL